MDDTCGLCGEREDDQMGEFVKLDGQHVYAHADCGLGLGLPLA